MDLSVFTSLEQKQYITQSQIQGLEILAMDNVELSIYMRNEYLENPIMEHQMKYDVPDQMVEFQAWYEKNGYPFGDEGNYFQEEEDGRTERAVDRGQKVFQYIYDQISQWNYDSKEMKIVDFMIESLDKNGFFDEEIQEVARILHTTSQKVERCLEDLRMLEPYGIFAKDLEHCLLRQLEVMGIEDLALNQIILEHLQDLGAGRISVVSRKMNLSTLQVRKYMTLIGKLNPRPLAGFGTGDIAYVVPDIILSYEDREWKVVLNDGWMGDYRLSDYYMKMMSETKDPQLFEYFKVKLERARFLLRSVEQRRETLLRIAHEIVKRQSKYFLGEGTLQPMNMADLAEEIKVHPSTVSRGIRGKYIQSPMGTVQIRKLFTMPVGSENPMQEVVNADAVKELIKDFIRKEDREKPYSDQRLKELLKEKNINVSRRVIAKYREEMGIKGSYERKLENRDHDF